MPQAAYSERGARDDPTDGPSSRSRHRKEAALLVENLLRFFGRLAEFAVARAPCSSPLPSLNP